MHGVPLWLAGLPFIFHPPKSCDGRHEQRPAGGLQHTHQHPTLWLERVWLESGARSNFQRSHAHAGKRPTSSSLSLTHGVTAPSSLNATSTPQPADGHLISILWPYLIPLAQAHPAGDSSSYAFRFSPSPFWITGTTLHNPAQHVATRIVRPAGTQSSPPAFPRLTHHHGHEPCILHLHICIPCLRAQIPSSKDAQLTMSCSAPCPGRQ
jgi:hypothetical protein